MDTWKLESSDLRIVLQATVKKVLVDILHNLPILHILHILLQATVKKMLADIQV